MDFWIRAAQLMLSLSILVVLHEFGHFIPAKLFKTRVEKFYLFFDPWFSLFKRKIKGTEWGIGWLPLGGYVKISGMVDESMDKEQLKKPAQPWEFRSKPAWQRLIIMLGGVTVNLILGIVIYIFVVYAYGVETLKSEDLKSGLAVHPYLEKYGLKSGDYILEVEGEKLDKATDGNVELLVRNAKNVKVKHADGTIENIQLPERIDYELFEEGAFPAFSLRATPGKITNVILVSDVNEQGTELKSGDLFYSLNGTKVSELKALDSTFETNKFTSFEVIRGADTIKEVLKTAIFKENVLPNIPAFNAGIRAGDVLLSINGEKLDFYDQIATQMYRNKGKKVVIEVLRGKDTVLLDSKASKNGMLGIATSDQKFIDKDAVSTTYLSFGESIAKGWNMGFVTLGDYVGQMKFLFTKKGASSVGGFGSIGKLFPTTWNWHIFWMNTAFISIVLAFMNILPIPALDGGHVVFLLYEIITGKEAPEKVMEYAQYAGFIILFSLLLYANGNDIYTAFFK